MYAVYRYAYILQYVYIHIHTYAYIYIYIKYTPTMTTSNAPAKLLSAAKECAYIHSVTAVCQTTEWGSEPCTDCDCGYKYKVLIYLKVAVGAFMGSGTVRGPEYAPGSSLSLIPLRGVSHDKVNQTKSVLLEQITTRRSIQKTKSTECFIIDTLQGAQIEWIRFKCCCKLSTEARIVNEKIFSKCLQYVHTD